MDPTTIALIISSTTALATTLLLPICAGVGFLIKNIKKSECCGSSIETRIKPVVDDKTMTPVIISEEHHDKEEIKSFDELYHN